jgi:hypothetical protein
MAMAYYSDACVDRIRIELSHPDGAILIGPIDLGLVA